LCLSKRYNTIFTSPHRRKNMLATLRTTSRAFCFPAQLRNLRSASSVKDSFDSAVKRLGTLQEDPGNEAKLKIYGLFKQATSGPVTADTKTPGWTDLVGKAKFAAWKGLGSLPHEAAMQQYIAYINELAGPEAAQAVPGGDASSAASPGRPRETLASVAKPRGTASVGELSLKTIKTSLSAAGVLTVTLHRPSRGNSFNVDMWNDLREVFAEINRDSAVRVVVLTGGAQVFSTGMDLGVFEDMDKLAKGEPCPGRLRESLGHVIQWLQDAISGPEKCVVPVIAAVSGHCIGGAVDLITACDLRYCTDDAQFCIKETDLAMVADIGTLQRLPKLIGDMQTRELAYTGRAIGGQEAQRLGLVLRSFASSADMQTAVEATAASIAEKSPLTVRGIKSTVLYSRDHSVRDSLHQVKLHNSAHLHSADLMEAMQAALLKSQPKFTGH